MKTIVAISAGIMLFLAGFASKASALSLIEASGNVIGTFKDPIKFTAGSSAIVGYARTFQKSSTDNRFVGLLPIAEWGVLNVNLVGASPDFSDLTGQQGLLGIAGGVRVNRVLAAAFPATAPLFIGEIPFKILGQTIYYETELGGLAGFDFTRSETVTGYYVGPQISLKLN